MANEPEQPALHLTLQLVIDVPTAEAGQLVLDDFEAYARSLAPVKSLSAHIYQRLTPCCTHPKETPNV